MNVRLCGSVGLALALLCAGPANAAAPTGIPVAGSTDVLRTAFLLTLLALIPAIVICMTSFVRTVIVLAMVRHAFGMPETPPNAVLISLSLFLTAFTMSPVMNKVNQDSLQPLMAGSISVEQAV